MDRRRLRLELASRRPRECSVKNLMEADEWLWSLQGQEEGEDGNFNHKKGFVLTGPPSCFNADSDRSR